MGAVACSCGLLVSRGSSIRSRQGTDPFVKCDVHRKNPDRDCGHTSLHDKANKVQVKGEDPLSV